MADKRALVLVSGRYKEQVNADNLVVGAGIKTTTGALTIDGASGITLASAISLAAAIGITALAGAGAFDFSAATGIFKTSTGAVTIGNGAVTVSGAATFTAAGTALTVNNNATVTGNLSVGGNVSIGGNLTVSGTTTTTQSETVLIADNHLYLNNGYTANPAQTGGLIVNYDPTTTTTTVAGAYVAGVAATSNPTVTTTGSGTFAVADIIQFSSSTNNNGLYEVLSHTGTTLTIRGIGVTATVEDFTQNQFTAGASDGATILKVAVSVIRSGTDGLWETGSGSATPITFTDLATASGSTLQTAYEAGNTITTSAGEGSLTINGTEDFILGGSVDAAWSTTGGFSATALTGAINLQTTASATLRGDSNVSITDNSGTISIGSSGVISASTAAAITIASSGAAVTLTGGAASTLSTTAGALTLTSAAAATWSTTAGALNLTSAAAATWKTSAGLLILEGAAGIQINGGAGTSYLTVGATSNKLIVQAGRTLETTGTGQINLPNNASARFQIEGSAVSANVTATNLGTLTAGSASNADSLHTHSAVTSAAVTLSKTAAVAIAAGNLLAIDNDAGTAKAYLADSNGGGVRVNTVGIAAAAASAGNPVSIQLHGSVSVPDAAWDSVPAVGDAGKAVFLSETAGNLTLTAPSTSGSFVQRIGIVTTGGTGAVTVAIQIGDSVELA